MINQLAALAASADEKGWKNTAPSTPKHASTAPSRAAGWRTTTYSKSGTELILSGEKRSFRSTGKECTCWAFHRLKHLLWLLFERASRCYEFRQPTLDVLSKCFEQRDALGSSDEYSEVVWS